VDLVGNGGLGTTNVLDFDHDTSCSLIARSRCPLSDVLSNGYLW
jgi:hypothetical protein